MDPVRVGADVRGKRGLAFVAFRPLAHVAGRQDQDVVGQTAGRMEESCSARLCAAVLPLG